MLILLLLPAMVFASSSCTLQANCSSSWDWASLLASCSSESNAVHPCKIEEIPPFVLENLTSSSLQFPRCSATTFRWQSLFTSAPQHVDISQCPINCSCDTAWIGSRLEHLSVKPPRNFQCALSCPQSYLARLDETEPQLGSPFIIEYNITGEVLPEYLGTTRKYFKWQGSKKQHGHKEIVDERSIRLEIANVTAADTGVVNVICWHCRQPLFAYFQVRIPSPLSLRVDSSDVSSFRLTVVGYPIERLAITVSDEAGSNVTQEMPSRSTGTSTKLWNTLLIRPETTHSLFHQRVFKVFTASCTDCPEDHLSGDVLFTVCKQEDPFMNTTSDQECQSIAHRFNRFNETDLIHVQHPQADPRVAPEPVVIVVLILFSLFLAIALLNAKVHNLKSVSWRKWRWSFRSRPSRRASHATEETMLRLEERLSMTSTDYTGHIIPCIKGGAVQIHEQIGKGAFGAVYCGSWEQTGPRSVAVKALAEADAEVEKEATLLCRLDHENIVRLYGLTRDGDRLLLVFEMMRLGDLRSYLKARAPSSSSYASFPAALDLSELKFIVRQIAKGLCYLVAQQIVHRDLAARNCLVDGNSDHMVGNPKLRPPITVKISDFGMSRRLSYHSDYYRMQNQSLLPVRWLPPEAISEHVFSSKSDIWSLGVTMWETFSYGCVPFDTLSNHEVVSYALAGMRPPKPNLCPNDIYALMEKCWTLDPEQRASAEDVLLDPAIAENLELGPL